MKSKAIHDAILATEKVFMAAYKQHDAKALVALYTKDAKIMPPNTKAVSGAKAMAALFKSFWDAGDTKIKLTTVEADGSVDVGLRGRQVRAHQRRRQGDRQRQVHRGLEEGARPLDALPRHLQQRSAAARGLARRPGQRARRRRAGALGRFRAAVATAGRHFYSRRESRKLGGLPWT